MSDNELPVTHPEETLNVSINKIMPELVEYSGEKEITFSDYCAATGVNSDNFEAAPITRPMVVSTLRSDAGHLSFTTSDIHDDTLQWLSTSAFSPLIRQAYRDRFTRGILRKPNLVRAYEEAGGLVEPNALLSEQAHFDPRMQIELLQKILNNPAAKTKFIDVLNNWFERTTSVNRGIELEQFIRGKFPTGEVKVYDIGCSDGSITERVAGNLPQAQVVGIDLEVPQRHLDNRKARYIPGDMFALPALVGEDSGDVLFSLNTLRHFHLGGRRKAMISFAHSVKENGYIVLGPYSEVRKTPVDDKPKATFTGRLFGLKSEPQFREESVEGLKVFQKVNGEIVKRDFIPSIVGII